MQIDKSDKRLWNDGDEFLIKKSNIIDDYAYQLYLNKRKSTNSRVASYGSFRFIAFPVGFDDYIYEPYIIFYKEAELILRREKLLTLKKLIYEKRY